MTIDLVLEIIATISGIVCVYLQTKEKILAWPFGLLSVSIAVYIFYQSGLYSDVILHIVFIFLNIYGWWHWATKRNSETESAPILLLQKVGYVLWPIAILAGAFFMGRFMDKYAGADLPYLDAFTTSGSLVAQYLLSKKVLENWLVWIVVDVVAISMYTYKGLYLFAFLFFVYLVLCVKGYFDWKKQLGKEWTTMQDAGLRMQD